MSKEFQNRPQSSKELEQRKPHQEAGNGAPGLPPSPTIHERSKLSPPHGSTQVGGESPRVQQPQNEPTPLLDPIARAMRKAAQREGKDQLPKIQKLLRTLNPTATLLDYTLLAQGFMGVPKAAFSRYLRPQNRDSPCANLVETRK